MIIGISIKIPLLLCYNNKNNNGVISMYETLAIGQPTNIAKGWRRDARKLVLKWTAPIYVGIDDTDDSPAVIHPVKS